MPSGIYIRTENHRNKISEGCKINGIGKWMKGKKFSEIPCQKMSKNSWLKGKFEKNPPTWKGGIQKQERNDPAYHIFVKKVKNRDNWKCKIDNKDCKGYCIVHHILPWRDFPELHYNINNGITLCQFHHPRKRIDEQKLIPFFQSMVEVIRII